MKSNKLAAKRFKKELNKMLFPEIWKFWWQVIKVHVNDGIKEDSLEAAPGLERRSGFTRKPRRGAAASTFSLSPRARGLKLNVSLHKTQVKEDEWAGPQQV